MNMINEYFHYIFTNLVRILELPSAVFEKVD